MSIVRAPRPDRDFMVIRNGLIRDERLSYRARGLLVAILSRPDDWRTTSEQLAREGKEGRDAIRACLRELETAGYVVSTRVANERGQWSTERQVFDEPRVCPAQTEDGFSVVGKPTPGPPTFGFPDVGGPGVVLPKTDTNNRDEETIAPSQALALVLIPDVERVKKPRPRNLAFDALAHVCGIDTEELATGDPMAGRLGKALSHITASWQKIGGDPADLPDEIQLRAGRYAVTYSTALTPTALSSNWTGLTDRAQQINDPHTRAAFARESGQRVDPTQAILNKWKARDGIA